MKKHSLLSGTSSGIIILSILVTPIVLAAPVNDNLPAALNIETLPYTHQQETTSASNEPAEKLPQCLNEVSTSVWYQYTPTSDQIIVIDTFGSNYDTTLSLWKGTTHPLTPLACNDDSSNTLQSQLLVKLDGGTTYYLSASGYQGKSGRLTLNAKPVNPLTNDALTDAIEITLDDNAFDSHTQNIQGATKETDELETSCVLKGTVASVWYQYIPTTDQRIVLDTIGSDYNTILSVWSGDTHPLTEVACNDDNGTPQSQLAIELTAQTPYYINIAASNSLGSPQLEGTRLLVFNVSSPPSNDNLANAIEITESLPYLHSQNTGGATLETNELSPSCVTNAGASVWYTFTPTMDYDSVTFSTQESGFLDTVLSVWEGGTAHPVTEKACNDNAIAVDQTLTSQLTMPLTANTPYYINVSGANGKTGHLVLRMDDNQTDFQISSQPQGATIETCTKTTLTVDLSTPFGKSINVTDNANHNSVEFPFIYRWYEGESGDDSQLVIQMNNDNHLTTPALGKTTHYWVRITNPTGTIDSETATITVTENTSNNGIGMNTQGKSLTTKAHFVGLITNRQGGDKNVPVVSQNDTIFVTFTIKVDSEHIGQPADIIMVGKYTTNDTSYYFMRNSDQWEPWDKNMARLVAAVEKPTLPACIELPAFEGGLKNMPGDFTAYVGYRLNEGKIFFNGEPVNFTVE